MQAPFNRRWQFQENLKKKKGSHIGHTVCRIKLTGQAKKTLNAEMCK
jgi:hypothetical protein